MGLCGTFWHHPPAMQELSRCLLAATAKEWNSRMHGGGSRGSQHVSQRKKGRMLSSPMHQCMSILSIVVDHLTAGDELPPSEVAASIRPDGGGFYARECSSDGSPHFANGPRQRLNKTSECVGATPLSLRLVSGRQKHTPVSV